MPIPPMHEAAAKSSAGDRSLLAAPVLFAATCLGIAATFDGDTGPTLCVVRQCTGGYCPGCGGSRAVVALAKGDLAGAWAIHPWVPLIVAQLLIILVVVAVGARDRLRRGVVPILLVNLALGVGIWVVRLFDGSIPVPFG